MLVRKLNKEIKQELKAEFASYPDAIKSLYEELKELKYVCDIKFFTVRRLDLYSESFDTGLLYSNFEDGIY